jgi:hypothetical protein
VLVRTTEPLADALEKLIGDRDKMNGPSMRVDAAAETRKAHCLTPIVTEFGVLPHLVCYPLEQARGGSMSKVSSKVRRVLVEVVSERYTQSSRAQKRPILDEFETVTGYHRKHAIRILCGARNSPAKTESKQRSPVHDEAVKQRLSYFGKRVTACVESDCVLYSQYSFPRLSGMAT